MNKIQEEIIDFKNLFFKYQDKKKLSVLAVTKKNKHNQCTWKLLDYQLIDDFENEQLSLAFGMLKLDASIYPPYTKIIQDLKKKKYILKPGKNTPKNSFVLAERIRGTFGESWFLKDDGLKEDLKGQATTIKIGKNLFHAVDYRPEIFLVQNKISKKKFLMTLKGKIPMKKS